MAKIRRRVHVTTNFNFNNDEGATNTKDNDKQTGGGSHSSQGGYDIGRLKVVWFLFFHEDTDKAHIPKNLPNKVDPP